MIDRIFLLNEEKTDEQEKILKYFYLIDSDLIVKELKSTFSAEQAHVDYNSMIESIFHTAFEKIFDFSSLYNEYIDPNSGGASAFFGEPGCKSLPQTRLLSYGNTLRCFLTFLKLSLRNHCITQGFFYSLSQIQQTSLSLSAKTDEYLKAGYFEKPYYQKENCTEPTLAQFYNSKFKSFKKLGANNFLERILKDCHCDINTYAPNDRIEKLSTVIKVPSVYKHWIYFVFHNDNVKNISRNLAKKNQKSLSNHYKNLFIDFNKKEKEFNKKSDKFIFRTLGEYYFGFSTINYSDTLLKQIHNPSEEYEYLKWYRGEILDNILIKLSCCPMPYTRHLFLSYAFAALRYNEDVKCNYLSLHANEAFRLFTVGTASSIEISSAKGLTLIPEYFNTLNNITLPILSSLWIIVLNKLVSNKDSLMEYYNSYIESHYELLTANFSSFLKCEIKEMKSCYFEKGNKSCKNDIYTRSFLEQLTKKLHDEKSSQDGATEKFLDSLGFHKDLYKIIYNFLKAESSNELTLQVLSNLYQDVPFDEPLRAEHDQFRINRALNIFELFHKRT